MENYRFTKQMIKWQAVGSSPKTLVLLGLEYRPHVQVPVIATGWMSTAGTSISPARLLFGQRCIHVICCFVLMPQSHFGFRRGKRFVLWLTDVEESVRLNIGQFYAIFVNCIEAFDLLSRSKVIGKLINMTGRETRSLSTVRNILVLRIL
jgi:hypothetical protein